MPFNKIILLALMVLAVGAGAAFAATRGPDSSSPAGITTGTTTGTSSVADVKGPCDEAEHANDPRCAGTQVPEDNDAAENEDANDDNGQAGDDGPNHDLNDDNGQADDDGPDHDAAGDRDDENFGPSADDDDSGPSDSSGPGGGDGSGSDDGGHSGHGGGDD
jgi:hypothetical protein